MVATTLSLPGDLDGALSASPPPALDGPRVLVRRRDTEQAHICLGTRALSYLHPDRYALDLLNTVLGEGMSSRLFLNIRERFCLPSRVVLLGEIKSIDEEVALVDGGTAADVRRVAQEVLGGPMQMAVIGPFTRDSAFRLAIGA